MFNLDVLVCKLALVSYRGETMVEISVAGCNLRCPYCNRAKDCLQTSKFLTMKAVFHFLIEKAGEYTGVVITGGEPTLHADLPFFIHEIRALTKVPIYLETNGTFPRILEKCLVKGVSVTILSFKYPLKAYGRYQPDFKESLALVREKKLPYIITTVVHKSLLSPIDLRDMGAILYSDEVWDVNLAKYSPKCLNKSLFRAENYSLDDIKNLLKSLSWCKRRVEDAPIKEELDDESDATCVEDDEGVLEYKDEMISMLYEEEQ